MHCDTEISKQSEWISCFNGDWGRAVNDKMSLIEFNGSTFASLDEEDSAEFAIINKLTIFANREYFKGKELFKNVGKTS